MVQVMNFLYTHSPVTHQQEVCWKGTVQNTGYYACKRCKIKRTSIKSRIVYDRIEESTLRSNDTFMSMAYAEKDEMGMSHQLAPSPIKILNINMINGFNLDYMHMVCLGVVRRMLYYFKGHFKSMVDYHSQVWIESRLICFHLKKNYQVNLSGSPGL